MSVYWIYMADPVQPMLQPMVTAPVLSPKTATDCVSAQVLCGGKVLQPPTILFPNESKSAWTGLTSMGPSAKQDNARHFHIFVGDLSPELDTRHLQEAFAPFGQTADCKIIRDQQTLKSKGYGFVSFVNKEDAEKAIGCMNGQWLGSRPIRTNWAIRKPTLTNQKDGVLKSLTFEEVLSQTSPNNCTVYCGGITSGLTEELLHQTFASFGVIQDIRVFKEKGYAFIRFNSKDSASRAIVGVHGSEVNGQTVKCSWGREPNDSPGGGGGLPPPPHPTNAFLAQQPINSALIPPPTNFAVAPSAAAVNSSAAIYAQLGYWNCAPCSGYSPSVASPVQGFLQPSYPPTQAPHTFPNYCSRLPTVQWSGQNGPNAPPPPPMVQGSIPGIQQSAILHYQTQQQGFQQA